MGIQPIRKTVLPEIPDKLYFRIGDVARLCEVPAYVLRFWETEFPQLKPNKGGTGQRLYRKRDVEMALRIKSLLYDQGYTIPGARQVFKSETKARESAIEPFAEASAALAPASALVPAFADPLPASEASESLAAAPEPVIPAVAAHSRDYDAGAEVRRQVKLHALRAELQALLELLQAPIHGSVSPSSNLNLKNPASQLATPQPLALRPRLMLEPRPPAPTRPEATPPETLRLVARRQQDAVPAE